MGCFLACFGDLKKRKRRKSANKISSTNHIREATDEAVTPLETTKQEIENPIINSNADSIEKVENETEVASDRVIGDEEVSIGDVVNKLDGIKEEEKRGKEDDAPKGSEPASEALCRPASGKPTHHRYADCSNSDDDYVEEGNHLDEEEEEEREDEDEDGGGKSKRLIQESSESLFSLSIDSRKLDCTVEAGEKEVNSPVPSHSSPDIKPDRGLSDRTTVGLSENVDSVLNSIENVTQWNPAKVKTTLLPVQHLEKESVNLENDYDVPISPEPTFKLSMRKFNENYSDSKPNEDDIAVDTSLSNWLVESETTPKSKSSTSSIGNSPLGTRNSARSYEDRPILGALTLEELRQFSAFSTPRRSRSRSPDETPIIGTVGSYWNHTGQDTNSYSGSSCNGVTKTARKNREDERVNWNSTPFIERLDQALTLNSAQV